jgi:hypothetical protein
MNRQSIRIVLLSALGALFCFSACDLEDIKDAAEAAGLIEDVPEDVNDFLTDEDLAKLEAAGMPIYKGDNPPPVDGNYDLNSLVIIYDEYGMEGYPLSEYSWRYYDQRDTGELTCDYASAGQTDVASGLAGYISGENNCFSVFIEFTGNASGCDYEQPMIQSGCMDDAGIAQFVVGYIMKKKDESSAACQQLMDVGAVRITEESDGMAELVL